MQRDNEVKNENGAGQTLPIFPEGCGLQEYVKEEDERTGNIPS